METNLRANISSLNAGQPVEILVFNLNQEGQHTIVFPFDVGLSKNDRMVCNKTKFSRPVLARTNCRRVNDPLLSSLVILSSSFKCPDIRSMTQLSLRIAAHYLHILRPLQILPLVLLCSHQFDVLDEHYKVDTSCVLMRIGEQRVGDSHMIGDVVSVMLVVVASDRQVAVGIFDEFQSALIVDIGRVGQSRASFQIGLKLLIALHSIDESGKFLGIKVGQTPLVLEYFLDHGKQQTMMQYFTEHSSKSTPIKRCTPQLFIEEGSFKPINRFDQIGKTLMVGDCIAVAFCDGDSGFILRLLLQMPQQELSIHCLASPQTMQENGKQQPFLTTLPPYHTPQHATRYMLS